jgi:hypothetical protein
LSFTIADDEIVSKLEESLSWGNWLAFRVSQSKTNSKFHRNEVTKFVDAGGNVLKATQRFARATTALSPAVIEPMWIEGECHDDAGAMS